MLRIVLYILAIGVIATGLAWLADRPGLIVFNWEGYEGEISVFHAVVGLTFLVGAAIFLWSVARAIWTSPAQVGNYFYRRRQKRGLDALSSGIIAIGAGDRGNATRYAIQARKSLPNEPLTHLLRAQAAQLSGDKATARRIFEAMLSQPDTEQLGLRGLFLEAQREGELEAAHQFAERALTLNPKLGWSSEALFDLQCKSGDWEGALTTLASAKKHGHVEKDVADRRRAVLLTAQAQKAEEADPDRAMSLAIEAHNLAPGLVPAAAIAGRMLASRGNTPKAAKILQRTWVKSPHPDLATAYAFARLGDSPRDRLDRMRQLANLTPNNIESPVAVARAAIDAKDFDAAREALEPLLEERLTQRVATLMARIEAEERGDKGRVREWLARAATASRDPAWTADGVVSETWAPVSPVTGQLDAFEWRVPAETLDNADAHLLNDRLDDLLSRAAPLDAIDARPVPVKPAAADVAADATPTATRPADTAADTGSSAAAAKPAPAPKRDAVDVVVAEPVTVPRKAPAPAAAAEAKPAAPASTALPAAAAAAAPKPASETSVPATAKPATVSAPPTATKPPGAAVAAPAKAEPATSAKPDTTGNAKAAPAADKPVNANAAERPKTAQNEPKIFVSPRAPDDPGPDLAESEDAGRALQRYGTGR